MEHRDKDEGSYVQNVQISFLRLIAPSPTDRPANANANASGPALLHPSSRRPRRLPELLSSSDGRPTDGASGRLLAGPDRRDDRTLAGLSALAAPPPPRWQEALIAVITLTLTCFDGHSGGGRGVLVQIAVC